MKFIIEPINDTDCRIIDVDCSDEGKPVKELTFPATVEQDGKTYDVKEVGKRACWTNYEDKNPSRFASLKNLKKIIFSEGIEKIEGVMSPYFVNSTIKERGNAESVKEVKLPSTLKVIGKESFAGCTKLTDLNIPDGVEVIEDEAFRLCESLPIFPWPKSLKYINIGAFLDMKVPVDENGESTLILDIPESIEQIEGDTSNTPSRWISKCNVTAEKWSILDGSNLTKYIASIDVPEGVTKISGKYKRVRQITLPSTIEEIGESAFEESDALECISELPKSLKVIGKQAFKDAIHNNEPKEIRISSPDIKVGQMAFFNPKQRVKLVGDEDTMKSLMKQDGAFNGTYVEAIDVPEGVKEVDIDECPALTSLVLPTSLEKLSIRKCDSLESLIIPDSVKEISSISKMKSLKTLKLPNQLESLYNISECDSLKEIELPDSLKEIGGKYQNGGLAYMKAEIKASPRVWQLICNIGLGMEHYNPVSGEIVLPEGVETIARECFWRSNFKRLSLPASLKSIGKESFRDCTELNSIEFSEQSSLEKIEERAFDSTAIKQIRLPDGLTTLGKEVFRDIETLEFIIFPASMVDYGSKIDESWKEIQSTPLIRCKNLKHVVFLADDPAKAVYPPALGKLCDWYVPDHMVDHVTSVLDEFKNKYAGIKGIGAKQALPLSSLKGFSAGSVKPVVSEKNNEPKVKLTKAVSIESVKWHLKYAFPILKEDLEMTKNQLDLNILALNYLKNRPNDSHISIELRDSGEYSQGDFHLLTPFKGIKEYYNLNNIGKRTVRLNFEDPESLPEGFFKENAAAIAKAGQLFNFMKLKFPNYDIHKPKTTPYLVIDFGVTLKFDFFIGEKEKFEWKKISLISEFKSQFDGAWSKLGLLYDGRFVPVSDITVNSGGYKEPKVNLYAPYCEEVPCDKIDNAIFKVEGWTTAPVPFINELKTIFK